MKKMLFVLTAGMLIGTSSLAQNLICNGGFELPNDGKKHLSITERTGWFSDDTTENRNGTEYNTSMSGNYYWFNVNIAGTIYQPIDKITSDSATYNVSYYYGTVYNADAGKDTIYSVVYFSHYTPETSIKNRILIDSIITDVTSANWKSLITASFKLPANVSYAGDSLVVEFATRVVDIDAVNNNTWTGADSIVVSKIGVNTNSEVIWKEFNVATKVDATNITSSTDFSVKGKMAWDSKYIYLKLDITDDSIYAESDTATYNRDNLEIYFDMNNGKLPLYPRGEQKWPSSYDGQPGYFQLRLIPGIPFDSVNTSYKGFAIQKYEVTETGYNFDLQICIDSLLKGYVPEMGKEIGFDVLASDNDNAPYYRDQLSYYAPSANIWCDAAMWGTIRFARNGSFDEVYDVTKPEKAKNIKVTQGNNQVLLTWDPATDNIVVEKYIIKSNGEVVNTVYAQKADNSCVIKSITPGDYTFSIIAKDIEGNQSDEATKTFTYSETGVTNTGTVALSIYPNPSSSFVTLNNDSKIKMEVFNISGQLVLLKAVNTNEKVDISNLECGVYSVRVIENNNTSLFKLIKK